ncbi:MAG: LemA family protein [Rubricoccaceae bacterium]
MRSTGSIVLLVVVLLVGFAGCTGCGTYNTLVERDNDVERAWADVQTQYQRRADLIPNIVSTVQGQAGFERETLESVVAARSRATSIQLSADDLNDPAAVQRFQEAQQQLGGALSRLLAVSENYPELRANEGFLALQDQLEGTENRIAQAVRDYNGVVAEYNAAVRRFPSNIWAALFGFDRRQPFQARDGADQAPRVQF